MSKLEKEEEAKAVRWAKSKDVIAIKFTPYGEKGWPDRIFILPSGEHVWVEAKRKGEEPRKLQSYRIQQLRDRGVAAYCLDSADKIITILEGHMYGRV